MRPIKQDEAERMQATLKTIAGFGNDALDPADPGQAAAKLARETLDQLSLYLQSDTTDS